jgi:predicted ATPase
MPRVIVSGAPGVGKTTLLAELSRLGYVTVAESAREVISERLARGESPRSNPEVFAREVYRRDRIKYRAHEDNDQLTFFDRSAVESLGMINEVQPLSATALHVELSTFSFHRTVFLLPPWEEIYCTDAERDHAFAHAMRVHESLLAWYGKCGYNLREVPRASVPERAHHLLHALSDA